MFEGLETHQHDRKSKTKRKSSKKPEAITSMAAVSEQGERDRRHM